MAEYYLRNAKLGLSRQTNWATPQGASANFKTINANTGITFDPSVNVSDFNTTGTTGIMAQETRRYIDGISGMPMISYSCPATKSLLADHLVAAFQKVSEAAITPYAKNIDPINAFLDFNADAGYVYSLALSPSGDTANDGIILENAVIDSLELTVDNLANGVSRLVNLNVTWKGNEMNFGQNLSGIWVAQPTTGYLNDSTLGFTLNVTIDALALTAVCWKRFTMRLVNNWDSDCKTTGGKANNYNIARPELTFEIDIPYTSSNFAILGHYKAGNSVLVNFYNGTGDADGTLNINSTKGTLTANPYQPDGDKSAIRLVVRAEEPSAGYSSLIQWTDSIDGAY